MGELRERLRALSVLQGQPPRFDPESAPAAPLPLLVEWLTVAIEADVVEPHAMSLATADAAGNPASRVLIVKDVDADGVWFASSAGSRKGRELAQRPYAAGTFYWPALARQVVLRGPVTPAEPAESAADFLARGEEARAEALVGRQSQVLGSTAERARAVDEARGRIEADPQLVAPGWTLYGLRPTEVEFWQGSPDRHHLRLRYLAQEAGWRRERLWS